MANRPETPTHVTNEIPGFYYDSDKKRYFRILPGHNNHNPINSTVLEMKKRERKWKTINTLNDNRKLLTNKPAKLCDCVALHQMGVMSPTTFSNHVLEKRMAQLECITKKEVDFIVDYPTQECRYLVGRSEFPHLIGAWALDEPGVLIQTIPYEAISTSSCSDRNSLEQCFSLHFHPASQLTDLSWATISPGVHFVLYSCTNCSPTESPYSTLHLLPARNVSDTSTPENRLLLDRVQNYEFPSSVIWSCAWNEETRRISVGMENFIQCFRFENGGRFKLSSNKEKPFSLVFNKKGTLLYCGTHKGKLLSLDIRARKASVVCSSLGRCISYIRLLSDENYIVTSAYDDKLQLVDLRRCQSVLQYIDHRNDHMKIPFSYDETSNILCSAGQDQVTRLWSLKDGKLIKSLPPPEEGAKPNQPWVWFSESWKHGFDADNLTLFMAHGKDFLIYRPTLL